MLYETSSMDKVRDSSAWLYCVIAVLCIVGLSACAELPKEIERAENKAKQQKGRCFAVYGVKGIQCVK